MTSRGAESRPGISGSALRLSYHGDPVVHDASIALYSGQITALVGPNGSGKSTLLRALARLHRPDSGEILLPAGDAPGGASDSDPGGASDSDPGGASDSGTGGTSRRVLAASLSAREFARRVTLLAQSRPTPSGVSVKDVVSYGRHPYRSRWRNDDHDGPRAIDWAMEVTGVESMADRPVDELSGGERQRVWLPAWPRTPACCCWTSRPRSWTCATRSRSSI